MLLQSGRSTDARKLDKVCPDCIFCSSKDEGRCNQDFWDRSWSWIAVPDGTITLSETIAVSPYNNYSTKVCYSEISVKKKPHTFFMEHHLRCEQNIELLEHLVNIYPVFKN